MAKIVKTILTPIKPKKNPYKVLSKAVSEDGQDRFKKMLFEAAQKEAARLRLDILQQQIKWVPLNAKYKAWKIRKGKSDKILIADGYYVSAIKARWVAGGRKIEIGLPNSTHPTAKMPYKKLAAIHEYGSEKANIPPRPHWRVSRARFIKNTKALQKLIKGQLRTEIDKIVVQQLGKPKK